MTEDEQIEDIEKIVSGGLYVTATPTGNLKDITLRALDILRNTDFCACEDTRHSRKLLNHYGIKCELVSYHSNSKGTKEEQILKRLEGGESCALISDAGTPGISDPGTRLVSLAIERGIRVIPIGGVSALTMLVSGGGVPAQDLLFVGFLPPKSGKRRNRLTNYFENEKKPIVFYESVHRIERMLADICEIFGAQTPVVLGRELSKHFEQIVRASVADILLKIENGEIAIKGEFCLLVDNR